MRANSKAHHMKSKTQIEIGARYWWQQRLGQSPELVEVIAFMPKSISRVRVKNVTPDRPYLVTIGTPQGQVQFEGERPKGSKFGINRCKGDKYDDVHIAHLTAKKPTVLRTLDIDKKAGRYTTSKTAFDA